MTQQVEPSSWVKQNNPGPGYKYQKQTNEITFLTVPFTQQGLFYFKIYFRFATPLSRAFIQIKLYPITSFCSSSDRLLTDY